MAEQHPMPSPVLVAPQRSVGLEPGDIVGGHELLREIGRGGMAEVWVARRAHASSGKFVAIKMVLPQHVGDEHYSGMFRSEAEVSAPLSHGNIVQVFDQGEDNGRSYLVMEWVDGVDLSRLLPDMQQLQQRDPYLRLRIAAYIVGQVLHGLSYAHKITSHRGAQLGIVHRDISPQNILVSVSGDVKVTDFGIAHRMSNETSGLQVKGKLRYMAPEQLEGQSHAPTVDLYAVGAVLHELLDGTKFRGELRDQMHLYRLVMGGVIPSLGVTDVPAELDAVRIALLQPDPARRPQTADAALLLLKRWAGYSEMKVELAAMCGLATGVVRPRTGPLVEAGQPTVPPPRGGAPMVIVARPEADAPVPRWGRASEALPASMIPTARDAAPLRDAGTEVLERSGWPAADAPKPTRDLEPTHSAVRVAIRETTATGLAPRAASKAWILLVGFAVLAIVGAVTTAWMLADRSEVAAAPARSVEASPVEAAVVAAPEGPRLEPITPSTASPLPSAPAIEAPPPVEPIASPPPAPVEVPEVAPPPAKPSPPVRPKAKPKSSGAPRSAAAAPRGPEVIVRFRLVDGLAGADVQLDKRIIAVRPHYDTRVASGTYAVRWRAAPSDPWRAGGSVSIGEAGEWKFLIGPSGAKVGKL